VIFVNRFGWPDVSATSQLLSDLTEDLAGSGVCVEVICARLRYEGEGPSLACVEKHAGVTIRRLWSARLGRASLAGRAIEYLSFWIAATLYLVWNLRAEDTVVAKSDPPLLCVAVALAAGLRGARCFNWLQDLFPEVAERLGGIPLPRACHGLLRLLRNWSLRRAHCNVVLSQAMGERLKRNGVDPAQIVVSSNWNDGSAVQPRGPEESLLRRSLATNARLVVGYSGNLGRAHDYLTLVGAAELLVCEEILFLMIGGGAGMRALRDRVSERRLPNFRFLGYQPRENLADSLAAADVHLVSLLPELEGLIVPSKLYGIMAAGRPVVFVGSPNGEIAALLRESACGITVPPGDVTSLAEHLRALAAVPEERARLGANARKVFERYFDRPAALQRWRQILSQSGT
jgi:glycosyltransferase involved in cell wall biosynthesis